MSFTKNKFTQVLNSNAYQIREVKNFGAKIVINRKSVFLVNYLPNPHPLQVLIKVRFLDPWGHKKNPARKCRVFCF